MKAVLIAMASLATLHLNAQTYTGQAVKLSNDVTLKGQRITEFQTDTIFGSDNKIPTSKAVRDYVAGHGGGGGGGSLTYSLSKNSSRDSTILIDGLGNRSAAKDSTYTPPKRFYENNAAANADSNRADKLVTGDEYYLPYNAGVFVKATFIKAQILLDISAILQGAYRSTNMGTELVSAGYVPLSQPYNVTPFFYTGNESVASIPANVVDWVLVELRSSVSTIVATRAAFIRQDGKIVDIDGVSPVKFGNAKNGNYYVAVRHRNHLGILTPTMLTLGIRVVSYDFTTAQTQAYNNGLYANTPMKALGGGKFGMWAGNTVNNTQVRFFGGNNDSGLLVAQDGFVGYFNGDIDMNGIVSNSVDRALLLAICGGDGLLIIFRTF